jgi:hypothetical protein
MCLKCREEITNLPPQINLIDDDFEISFELSFLLPILRRFMVF